jgi:hypothetical protein
MLRVAKRHSVLLGILGVLALTGSGGASPASTAGTASAEAFAIQVSVPGSGGASAGVVTGPPGAAASGSFAYPADGSIASAGSISSRVSGGGGKTATAAASVQVSGLSLFGGEITVGSVSARGSVRAGTRSASGHTSGSSVSGLVVMGQSVAAGPGTSVPYGQWGTVSVLQQSAAPFGSAGSKGYKAGVTALVVHLSAEHAGAPAGTDIVVGFIDVAAEMAAPPKAKPPPPPRVEETQKPKRKQAEDEKKDAGGRPTIPPIRPIPADIIPRLTAGGYVFPVYGQASFTNSFGVPRGGRVGWHHGEDIFAPLGAPIVAVSSGTVYSVGWNDLGGLRLWLQDTAGNEFYYAHLSAFSPLAVNGTQVRAGDVLGFVGNTGDAESTPPHLHFEIHPVSLLYLGYDGGVVAPYPYLMAWKRLTDLPLSAVSGWAFPFADSSRAPKPGAILLQSRDISSGTGLDPASLRRALRATGPVSADGSIAGLIADGRQNLRELARVAARGGTP